MPSIKIKFENKNLKISSQVEILDDTLFIFLVKSKNLKIPSKSKNLKMSLKVKI